VLGGLVERGPDHAGLDQGGADAERRYLRGVSVEEALDAELGGVVEGEAGEGDDAAHAGHLQDAPAALLSQVRGDRSDELDRADQVGGDDPVDLLVGVFLGGAEDSEPGVGDDDVDAAELREGGVDDLAHLLGVRDVELTNPQPVAVLGCEIV
jgi:hypothetical protein